MASTQKITLSTSRDIPFCKLVLSQSNVRRVKTGVSIEDLAEDIARRTLLQSLSVRPVLDADGVETGMFEVPAGGRRYRALQLLVKQKRLAKTAPVPCVVRDPSVAISAEEDSLAENAHRVELHPLDQFRAFKTLSDQGLDEEDIAARFFVTPAVVKQRLRLAAVSSKLLDVYAEDGMTLQQLMAFTVTNDHARQEQVWDALAHSYNKEPFYIRRQLTEGVVRASDRRALFVGADAYEAAGGVILRDLFESDDGGWLQDPALLDTLATEKLKQEAEAVAVEGWKWIAVAVDFSYGHANGLRRLAGETVPLSDEEYATRESLRTEFDRLEQDYAEADEIPDEVDERLGEIETALAAFEDRPVRYAPGEIVHAGAFVSIDRDGDLFVERGFVRPEDEAASADASVETQDEDNGAADPSSPAVRRAVITIGGDSEIAEDEEEEAVKPLPERLVTELTAYRTLALRDAVANHPHVALTALLHTLCRDRFGSACASGCLQACVRDVSFPVQAPDLKDSAAAKAIAERQAAWEADMPDGEPALWDWLASLDDASRMALLAHCVSYGVNALYEKADPYGRVSAHGVTQRIAQADRLARAVALDLVEAGWRPTVDNYLGRITKPRILDAVREAKGEQAAQLLDHLKKAEMAKEAERLLDGTGWLPEPLRLVEEFPNADGESDALPAFLESHDDTKAGEEGVLAAE